MATEDGMLIWDKSQIPRHFSAPIASQPGEAFLELEAYERWAQVAQEYSSRQLTKLKDKVAALAGVTVRYQNLFNDVPLLGLWREGLPAGLLWRVTSSTRRIPEAALRNIPSWSWLSVDGPVDFPCDDDNGDQPYGDSQLRVEGEPVVEWEGTRLTSPVKRTELRVKGRIAPESQFSDAMFWFDDDPPPEEPVQCLQVLQTTAERVIGQYTDEGGPGSASRMSETTEYFLVLVYDARRAVYSRVGMGSYIVDGFGSSEPFEGCGSITIELV